MEVVSWRSVWKFPSFLAMNNVASAVLLLNFWLILRPRVNGHIENNAPSKQIYVPGDVILGGLFTLHVRSSSERISTVKKPYQCHGTFSRRAFQTLHGMLMAVRQINANAELLPGIKIGVDIKDTCGSVDFAVRESLNFSFVRKYFKEPTKCQKKQLQMTNSNYSEDGRVENSDSGSSVEETVAIIGPDSSEIARAVSDLAGLFSVPVVSPSATSEYLGDRKRFKHFFRTVPSDTYQTRVIANLLAYFKWNYIVLLTSDDEYGRSGRRALKERMENASPSICTIIDDVIIPQKVPQLVRMIKAEKKARVIVLFADVDYVMQIIDESKAQSLHGYTWISSDGWTGARIITKGNEKILHGMLGVGPIPSYIPRFKEELAKIAVFGSKYNVWVDEFQEYEKQTCNHGDLAQCILDERYELSPYIGATIDAVYAVAHALHEMLRCSTTKCQRRKESISNSELVEYLKRVKFIGVSGREVSFDWFGSGSHWYQVMNLQQTESRYTFVPVAEWHYKSNETNVSKRFSWKSKVMWNKGIEIPKSTCSNDCMPGQRRRPQKTDPRCCWTCVMCGGNTIPNNTNKYTCAKCPENYWPNIQHTKCLAVKEVYIKWDDLVVKIILSLASIGLAMVIFTAIVFMKFRATPVVKAASRGLCYLLLTGVSLLYLMPFTMIGRPNHVSCKSIPFTLGLCLSLNVGTMLIKTNRIARIFSKRIMRRNTHFLSSKWQYLMVFFIVTVEEAICFVWLLAFSPPHVESGFFVDQISRVLTCSFSGASKGLAIWSLYNAGLILVCTYQAFLVRKVPHNYNEAKFIAFTMISICITILVYIPVHVGTVSYSKDIICCFLYTFVATVEFSCIFAPKLYIILLRPSKNIEMQISDSSGDQRSGRNVEMTGLSYRESKRRRLEIGSEAISNQSQYGVSQEQKRDRILCKKRAKRRRKKSGQDSNGNCSEHSLQNGDLTSLAEIFEARTRMPKDLKSELYSNALDSLQPNNFYSDMSDSKSTISSDNFSSSEITLRDEKASEKSPELNNQLQMSEATRTTRNIPNQIAETEFIDKLIKNENEIFKKFEHNASYDSSDCESSDIIFPRRNKRKVVHDSNKTSLRRLILSNYQKRNESSA